MSIIFSRNWDLYSPTMTPISNSHPLWTPLKCARLCLDKGVLKDGMVSFKPIFLMSKVSRDTHENGVLYPLHERNSCE